LIIGEPITIKKVYQFAGIDPSSGIYQFINAQGNIVATPNFSADRIAIVNPMPKFYGGFQNNLAYKNFQLDFLFQFVKQMGNNFVFGNTVAGLFNTNQPVSVLNRWRKAGDAAHIQKYNSTASLFSAANNARSSNGAWSDASFIRLKNVSLSWQIPSKWRETAHLKNSSLYVQSQNLLTFTHFKGLDPENQSISSLPPLRVITVGIQVGL
jgi:TonB-dependent starch-binding outer membrane protein SusC